MTSAADPELPSNQAASPPSTEAVSGPPKASPDEPSPLGRALARWPLKLCLGFTLLSLAVGEWFPLSHYPMYAHTGRAHWYLYVTDTEDRPIACKKVFGIATSFVKKIYRDREAKLGKERAVEETLAFLYDEQSKARSVPPSALRLWRMDLQIRGTKIQRRPTLLGEYERP